MVFKALCDVTSLPTDPLFSSFFFRSFLQMAPSANLEEITCALMVREHMGISSKDYFYRMLWVWYI